MPLQVMTKEKLPERFLKKKIFFFEWLIYIMQKHWKPLAIHY